MIVQTHKGPRLYEGGIYHIEWSSDGHDSWIRIHLKGHVHADFPKRSVIGIYYKLPKGAV